MTTAGEGGMLTTNDTSIWSKAWSFKDHGKSFDVVYKQEHPAGFRWLHESFGTNFRLSEIQSIVGRLQLRKVPNWVELRRANARKLNACCAQFPAIRVTEPSSDFYHSYYRHYAYVRKEQLKSGWTRDRILSALVDQGIPALSGGCSEIYLEKAFPDSMRPAERLPVARELGETTIMLPIFPTLSESEIEEICIGIQRVMEQASR
jgi:hypothetical protein